MKLEALRYRHRSGFTLGPLTVEGPRNRPWLLLGPTGSGKSTLLRLLGGRLRADGGRVAGGPPADRRAYLPQLPERALAGRHLAEDLTGHPRPTAVQRRHAREALREVGLGGVSLARHRSALSAGQRRRVTLALVFGADWDAFGLDEPDAGLDRTGVRGLLTLLERQLEGRQRLCWIATHRHALYRGIDPFVIVLDRGRLVGYGDSRDVLSRKKVAEVLRLDEEPAFRFWRRLGEHVPGLPTNVYEKSRTRDPRIAQVQEILMDRAAVP